MSITYLTVQSAQRTRRKPCPSIRRSRKASNAPLINAGKPAPVLASTWARKVSSAFPMMGAYRQRSLTTSFD